MEISTFIAKGQSYEAAEGNHDDLMMNLVMFGYFASSRYFSDMTNIDLKQMLFDSKMKEIEDDMVPFGHIDDGSEHIQQLDWKEREQKATWAVEYDYDLGRE